MISFSRFSPRTALPRRAAAWATLALAALAALPAQAVIPASQRQYLIDLYNHTNGASWTFRTNWLGAVGTECTWIGVTCDGGQNTVIALSLGSNNLTDPVAALLPDWSALPDVRLIDLSGNNLAGQLPAIAALAQLRTFIVANNDLQGTLPSPAGLPNLLRYEVNNNQLTGTIPPLPATLERLRVHNNQLTGAVPAPTPALVAGGSALCPNQLTASASAAWDAATGSTPWYAACSAPPAAATSIPTLSEWGLILVSLAAAALGMGAMRRRGGI